MSLCRCLMLLSLALAVTGCVTKSAPKVTPPPGQEYRTGITLEPGYARDLGFSHRWVRTVVLAKGQRIHSAQTLGNLFVTVERPANVVTAINADNGDLVWKVVVGDELEDLHTAFADEEHIYVNSNRRVFGIDRRRGEVNKVSNLAYTVNGGPAMNKKLAIFGGSNGRVFAHHVDDGYKKWVYGLEHPVDAPPLLNEGLVFVADTGGHYAMLDANNGELRWRGETYGRVSASPVPDRAFVLLASEDQSLYSFVATTGRERWLPFRSEVPLNQTPVVIDSVIYLVEPGLGLTGIDANTGQALWTGGDVLTPVAPQRNATLAHDAESIVLLDPATGDIISSAPTEPTVMIVPGPGQSLIVVAQDGELVRVDPL